MFVAHAVVVTASGPSVTYGSGPAATEADAVAELKTKLALVVGAVLKSASVSKQLDIATEGLALHASGLYEEATLVLQKPGPLAGQVLTKNVKIENMSLAYKVVTVGQSFVDVTAGDIGLFVTAYHDGEGVGGYTATPGLSHFRK
jgi:hypothetical protein